MALSVKIPDASEVSGPCFAGLYCAGHDFTGLRVLNFIALRREDTLLRCPLYTTSLFSCRLPLYALLRRRSFQYLLNFLVKYLGGACRWELIILGKNRANSSAHDDGSHSKDCCECCVSRIDLAVDRFFLNDRVVRWLSYTTDFSPRFTSALCSSDEHKAAKTYKLRAVLGP